jgi:2-(1,2-epoxy-1,2-dihydrophenyl)acetyl-CoA isomerase
MTENNDLTLNIEGAIARIAINRPDALGAMKSNMWADMTDLLRRIEHDENVRCVVIESVGKHFCAGADVKEFAKSTELSQKELAYHWMKNADQTNHLFMTIERIPQPVIASVRGVAAGGGLGIVTVCDLIIASETANFFAAQVKLGAIPDSAVSFNLRRAIGVKKAKQYCYLGDSFDAAEAADMGLVNWVVEDEQLEAETDKLAKRLAKMPGAALPLTKRALNRSFQNSLAEHLAEEPIDVGQCVSHPDFSKMVRAFASKSKT